MNSPLQPLPNTRTECHHLTTQKEFKVKADLSKIERKIIVLLFLLEEKKQKNNESFILYFESLNDKKKNY